MAQDVARVRAVRAAVGPDIRLMIDANCAYRHYEAIQLARRIEEQDIFWYEETMQPDDDEGFFTNRGGDGDPAGNGRE